LADIADAAARLRRFAPYVAAVFPETRSSKGLIESPLADIPGTAERLGAISGSRLPGKLLLKCDSHLPISGSIKARGGIYEVLKHAETLAVCNGLLSLEGDYRELDGEPCRRLFSEHSIVVGSTGNLGLSIGIMSARLGFQVTVHMSSDARQWKKDMLRSKGVRIVEHTGDYSKAVEQGRIEARNTPRCHFVDDENSRDLFLGYSVAAERLQQQLIERGIVVDCQHPLFVYLPCGVGGGPGGVAFGLKHLYGDHVYCFFAEPTHSPCMLLGMYTGLHDRVSVQEFGIDNKTCADGLAVGRPSAFVGRLMESLLSGIFTVNDQTLYRLLALVKECDGMQLEPSALAGLSGAARLMSEGRDYLQSRGLGGVMGNACHVPWATGGSMVPETEWLRYYQAGIAPPDDIHDDSPEAW
jgi:D-serine dehydratase